MEFSTEPQVIGGTVELGHLLGSGGFGKVYYGYDKKRKMDVAVKVIEKELVEMFEIRAYVDREIEVMRKLRNRFVVRLLDSVESPTAYNLIMELAPNGELFDKIVNADRFDEATARLYFQQLICAVHYCHGLNIVHRDLKAENLLLGKDNELKICDWGLSRYTREAPMRGDRRIRFHSLAGSIDYQAPEVLSGRGYEGSACDIWSCGAILFFMLCGYLPFTDTSDALTKRRILNCEYNRTNRYLSSGASDLISHLLEVDPVTRYNTTDVINHPWFQTDLDPTLFPDVPRSPHSATTAAEASITSFAKQDVSLSVSRDDVTTAASSVDLQAIRRAFATCNVNGTGFLDAEEVRDALIKLNGNNHISAEEVTAFMSNFTLDAAGRISEEEFVAGWTRNEELGKKYDVNHMAGLFHYDLEAEYLAEVRRAFDSIDVNHTGLITTESLKKLSLNCTDEEIKDFFNVVDPEKVGNGMLSFEQFVHLCSRHDLFKNHPIVQRLRRLEKIFVITDIRWMQSYTGTGFTVAGTRENVALHIKSHKALSTKFEGKDQGFMYGTYTVNDNVVLRVGLHLISTLPGYTRVSAYRIVGKTKDFHAWILQLRKVLRHEILRCEEDTLIKGKPELM
ncbi:protein kinase, putative [Trypanosoma brucei gambiense DAL972]|uniref:non-specific serine/threonine protein kinase n=1 Tax=Trypanosoma brucei gambiense (strain MHOM/CI/86/DAL972) TaxID=679716 RepID=C9ZIW2_TRYB9|nr:protein kinase, putative [Trypanosoma brucei gambiense DAL972]CBH09328.1 protein kinase, putative [Trypanosoma brucei gambiense DAL972]|eukprot:XP_011771636.1 protein kinase, putative [Trypanosoma brucei gambiense DAL972]